MVITGNNLEEMKDLYDLSYDRIKEGGFELRSWNTNSDYLRELMENDGRLVEHECPLEKVLGYRYEVASDQICLAPVQIKEGIRTKREILSQISKVYDPLNLALPVTVRGRILMRKVWKSGVEWDKEVPKDLQNEMKKLGGDLEMLSELKFPRQAINENKAYGLHVFCDSSKEAYGMVAYACSETGESNLIFAKSKLAPLNRCNDLSVPTLELMGVVLALKCIFSIMEAHSSMQIQFVNICVDAQVVLNWLLTKDPKVKSKFVRNRVLESNQLMNKIKEKFKIPLSLRYIKSEQKPADLVTKGISYQTWGRSRASGFKAEAEAKPKF